MKSIANPGRVGIAVAVTLLLAAAVRIYLYWMGGTYIPVTTDEALTVLQAVDIRNGELPLLLAAQPYMFPLEAYWMAPLVDLLPRTAFGMRVLVMIEGLAFVVLSLLALRAMGDWRRIWPAALLVLFPSVYLVMNQTAYSQPHNNSAFILVMAAACIIFRLNRPPARCDLLLAAAGGFFMILAFSNAMLSLSMVAPLAVIAVWHSVGRGYWKRLAGYVVGGLAGIVPYAAAIILMPGAHGSVTASHSIDTALGRLWSPTMIQTLPVTFGFRPTPFPDRKERLDWGVWGHEIFPYLFSALLVAAVLLAVFCLLHSARKRERPYLGGLEFAIGASILCCFFFMLSTRANSGAYRYLAPLLVVFPFLIAGLMMRSPRPVRRVIAALSVVLAAYNLATAFRIAEPWKEPGFAAETVAAPDLEPAISFLREQGIGHAVASHWAAYRIGFQADGDVVCSQPFNERFHFWPVPYKDEVDAATNVAYVLTDKVRFLKPDIFERHMRTMGVSSRVHTAGHFTIYYDFSSPLYDTTRRLRPDELRVETTDAQELTPNMLDGDLRTYWRSTALQETGMSITLYFEEPTTVTHTVLKFGRFSHDRADALKVESLRDGEWTVLHDRLELPHDKFRWYRGKPVYGVGQETIHINEDASHGIRISIAKPRPEWCWTIIEAEVYTPRE